MCIFKNYYSIFQLFIKAPAFSNGVSVGSLSPEIFHASGLAASQKHDRILYTHNDGDDVNRRSPIIYAISATSGSLIARLRVFPATNEDWEDIAVGPCGNTTCIYVLDKSANTIYRVQEPDFVYSDQILSLDSKVEFMWVCKKIFYPRLPWKPTMVDWLYIIFCLVWKILESPFFPMNGCKSLA